MEASSFQRTLTVHGVEDFSREVTEPIVAQFLKNVLVGYPKWC